MKISYKLLLGYVIVFSFIGAMSVVGMYVTNKIKSRFEKLEENNIPDIETLAALQRGAYTVLASTNKFGFVMAEQKMAATTNVNAHEEERQIADGLKFFHETLKQYKNLVSRPSASEIDRKRLQNINALAKRIYRDSSTIIRLKEEDISGDAVLEARGKLEQDEKIFLQTTDEALKSENEENDKGRKSIQFTVGTMLKFIPFFGGVMLFTTVGLGELVRSSISISHQI